MHASPKEVAMKHVAAVIIWCSLIVPALVFVDSDAWSSCTIEQRIELGKQGYEKAEVEKACRDHGDDFLDILTGALQKGAEIGWKKLDPNGNNNNPDASLATNGARICSTNYGTCPLSGGPVGNACYCRTRNGYTSLGISK
jgi:hypothetical protein